MCFDYVAAEYSPAIAQALYHLSTPPTATLPEVREIAFHTLCAFFMPLISRHLEHEHVDIRWGLPAGFLSSSALPRYVTATLSSFNAALLYLSLIHI